VLHGLLRCVGLCCQDLLEPIVGQLFLWWLLLEQLGLSRLHSRLWRYRERI
jgi:hypothetical protein